MLKLGGKEERYENKSKITWNEEEEKGEERRIRKHNTRVIMNELHYMHVWKFMILFLCTINI
jgi:hypothetical protein